LNDEGMHRVHLAGAGGVGMAGLARLLQARGLDVSGCDLAGGALTEWLQERGIPVASTHDPAHVEACDWVIRSTAVPRSCTELRAAEEQGKPIFMRGAVLAALSSTFHTVAVTGTHGKTSTASMLAQVFQQCGKDPNYCVGGVIEALDGVAGTGKSDLLVIEADESDGTAALYEPSVGVLTNIEYDHMEHFANREAMEAALERFACAVQDVLFFCADDPVASRLCAPMDKAVSYGLSGDAAIRAELLDRSSESWRFAVWRGDRREGKIVLPAAGPHNVQNALAAYAVAVHEGCLPDAVCRALGKYVRPKRRFEILCSAPAVEVVSDYAHHPTEIGHVLAVARERGRVRIVTVFQPHRFTRTLALKQNFPGSFDGTDVLVLCPVYPASEEPIEGGTLPDLVEAFRAAGRRDIIVADSVADAWRRVRALLQEGDLLLVLGAGDVEEVAFSAAEVYGDNV
jgi:UDP-N-acetylmuramate--alanine ligase